MTFEVRYKKLNDRQKQAVDLIEGPVMVIAGPGTGKTELLSMRVANILKRTDTLPENILCLTFTDSAADAMRARLVSIIGQSAYKVAVHTFHSFGTEIINQNSQFFYGGASFKPADELSSYELLRGIFDDLDYTNPLASKMNGQYVHLRDTLSVISQLKKSGLTSSEITAILDTNDEVMALAEAELADVFSTTVNKNTALSLAPLLDELAGYAEPTLPADVLSYAQVLLSSLRHAIEEAATVHPTKPITSWKNKWLKKDALGTFILKSRERQVKLRAAVAIYDTYLSRMQEAQLFDFDDMILQVVHALETQPDLRFNIQEKYQYVMVDEFQDTNMAQARILHNLTDNPVNEGRPNIMVVGDDDQAIYSFQGADVGNIITFQQAYPESTLITLTDNYRSVEPILRAARGVITQGNDRLESHIGALDKTLTPHHTSTKHKLGILKSETKHDERTAVVESIARRIKSGQSPNSIAVLARRHSEIVTLLPHFADADILVNYEKRENVLENELIVLVETLAKTVLCLAQSHHRQAEALLPQLMAHPAWQFAPQDLWQLSLTATREGKSWMEIMAITPTFIPLHGWLIKTAQQSAFMPLERLLDRLIGANQEAGEELVSPLFDFYFSDDARTDNPADYIAYLEALRCIRIKLREYHPGTVPTLHTFVEFIELHRSSNTPIMSIRRGHDQLTGAVNLMTAHKSKGLEFDTVYVIGCVDTAWGEKVRMSSPMISYPENLPLAPSGATLDERLRLFFVAMTRAKNNLILSYASSEDNGKGTLKASFLLPLELDEIERDTTITPDKRLEDIKREWYAPLVKPLSHSMKDLLAPTLEHYKLSATHLNSFIDVPRGGPQQFLLSNLLRFPSAMSPHAAYGSAMHATLQRAHNHLKATKQLKPLEDVLHDFEKELSAQFLSPDEFEQFLGKGSAALGAFLEANYNTFHPDQLVELSFTHQQVMLSDVKLKGALDLVEIDETAKTLRVTDYKTGKPMRDWKGKTDGDKLKAHKYKQQLMFYKLLVENSRDYGKYTVESATLQFVEPTPQGEIMSLDLTFDKAELEDFTRMIQVIWRHITTLDLPDTSNYAQNYKGVLEFEADLLAEH